MHIEQILWGDVDGQSVSRYLIKNSSNMQIEVSEYGALIVAIRIPLSSGERDIVLGHDTLEEYTRNDAALGAYVGRNCNRIAGATVVIDGERYGLEANDHGNNLHSGSNRSFYQLYNAISGCEDRAAWVEFSRVSPHLEQGFPGDLEQHIRYMLTEDNALIIDYRMISNRATVVNPTNHSYFNLEGQSSGAVLDHRLQIHADTFLTTDEYLIPTGERTPVDGTPMDFRQMATIQEQMNDDYEPIRIAGGYDHNYCLDNDNSLREAALLQSPNGDVTMTVWTDRPGLQVYTGNFLNEIRGKDGAIYNRNAGICFETQAYPNACNDSRFSSSMVGASQEFHSRTEYRIQW